MLKISSKEAKTIPTSMIIPMKTNSPIEMDDTWRKWLLGGEKEPAALHNNDQLCTEQCQDQLGNDNEKTMQ